MARVGFERVEKVYDDGTHTVADLNLEIADGELLVLVGPSGCGKSTALRMVAGLEGVSVGAIRIGDRVVNDVPPRDRDVAMVFQSYALYPHLTVADNIGFGLKLRKVAKAERQTRVTEAARILGLTEVLERKPRNLSGGQRQRVAMGRAIVREPALFLMDEPLSNLDAKLRVQTRAEIARIQRNLGVTTIYVTHDQTEAMTLGTRVAVMRRGRLLQVDRPQVLYDDPRDLFVAGFIGSPAMNFLPGAIVRDDDRLQLELGEQRLDAPGWTPESHVGRKVVVGVRPEDLALGAGLQVQIELVEAMGSDQFVHARADLPPVITDETVEATEDELAAGRDRALVVARLGPRDRVEPGDRLELAVATHRLHLFDPDTGGTLRPMQERNQSHET